MQLKFKYTCFFITIIGSMSFGSQAAAQLPNVGESIEERQHSRSNERLKQFEDDLLRAPSGIELPKLETEEEAVQTGNCVQVDTIEIVGQSKGAASRFNGLKDGLEGQCLYISDINGLLRMITNSYIEDGFVTSRAILPEQDLNDGSLEIGVVEGHVEGIEAIDEAISPREIAFAFPIRANKRLNLRDIEQGIDQLSRLPSKNPTTDIKPGENVGGSIIVVEEGVIRRPWRASVTVDNSGQSTTGENIISGTFATENILGVNDLWNLSANTNLGGDENSGVWGVNGFLSIPYGYFSTSFSGGYFEYESLIPGLTGEIDNDGTSWNVSSSLDWLVYRDAKRKLSLTSTLGITDNDNFVSDVRLLASSFRLVTVSLGVDYQERIFGGVAFASANWKRGTDILGADAIFTGDDGPQQIFNKLEYDLNFSRPLNFKNERFLYSASLSGQFSDENLFSAERISIGSPSAVRGFRAGGVSGDEGVFLRQELNWFGLCCDIDSGWFEGDLDVSAFVALDVGRIRNDAVDSFERGVLKSVSAGGRTSIKNLLFSVSVSHGFSSPFFVERDDLEVNASVTVNF